MSDAIEQQRREAVMRESFLIVARGRNGVIGSEGRIPWRQKADMRHFRNATLGSCLVVGRTTFDGLPSAMPGRTLVVVTSRPLPEGVDAMSASSFEDAVEAALQSGSRAIGFAGGPRIYEEAMALPWLGRAMVTEIDAEPEGDSIMPPLGASWTETIRTVLAATDGEPDAVMIGMTRETS
jgi:dihydrofolate reductase